MQYYLVCSAVSAEIDLQDYWLFELEIINFKCFPMNFQLSADSAWTWNVIYSLEKKHAQEFYKVQKHHEN